MNNPILKTRVNIYQTEENVNNGIPRIPPKTANAARPFSSHSAERLRHRALTPARSRIMVDAIYHTYVTLVIGAPVCDVFRQSF